MTRHRSCAALLLPLLLLWGQPSHAATTLADQPVFASADVPGNLALALSVEYPTAISVANLGNYADASTYLGYFDPAKCYTYTYNSTAPASSYFQPVGLATGTNSHSCSSKWSGNFMNWATMQTIDPFRWALTGGYRVVDSTTETILQKAWGSSQGSQSNFPLRGTSQATSTGHNLASGLISSVVPLSWTAFNTSIWKRGNTMVFSGTGTSYSDTSVAGTDWQSATASNKAATTYRVYVRVKVCDSSSGAGGVESNCVLYPNGQYKPEGLMQSNANKIRYSAFSYLNGQGVTNQGAVLRAPMGFIGPTYPSPLSSTVTTNPKAEWSSSTGVMVTDPDTETSSATSTVSGVTIGNSGVMNYLNKFGTTASSYMTYDNVSELYYAAVRYFQNLGNVATWTSYITPATTPSSTTRTTLLDGFPAVSTWVDPVKYSCQKNFILGIGDTNTHYDYNVGGGSLTGSRTKPAEVSSDTLNTARTSTNNLLTLEGLTSKVDAWWNSSAATYYIAGLAYGAHTKDIRSDLSGTQTISTYWMDVMEYQTAADKNPYWLAAKYGGFAVPSGYDPAQTSTALTQSWWNSAGDAITMGSVTEQRPDNYYLAGNASQMVAGLTKAFSAIASAVSAYTTAFALSTAQVSDSGTASYAAQYASKNWSGVVTASSITIASDLTTALTVMWTSTGTLATQLASTGWDTARRVVTWNGSAGQPFRYASLTTSQKAALVTSYRGSDGSDYLNYLRGDQSQEAGSTVSGSSLAYRARTVMLGDIVNSKITPVAAPGQTYSDSVNPGYAAFKSTWASRPTVAYVGANDGMLHAFNGTLSGTGAGTEIFAYVPSALFQGPSGTPNTAASDGLTALGNPSYTHRYYVDATPLAFDIDFNYAGGSLTTSSAATSDWHSVLIGGLGKGGKSFYAIDVTNPAAMTSESVVAGKVLWEFTDATMGYSFGEPVVVKTAKYGWVAIVTSGYNNSDGYGYIYILNPKTGALLEKVRTGSASNGLAHASAYVRDFTDGTADAVYAGDLDGQLWRFDLTGTTTYAAPLLLATLTRASGSAQPVTTQPLIEIQPSTGKRYVMAGTGQLLSSSDVSSSSAQAFYALIDGTASAFNTASALPSGVSFPLTRANLIALTDLTTTTTLSGSSMGWYIDLGSDSGTGIAWRMVVNPTSVSGVVAFSSTLTNADACSPSGTSRAYAINFGTGQSALDGNAAYISLAYAVTDLRFLSSSNGGTSLSVGSSSGTVQNLKVTLSSSASLRLLNWREIPTID
jgi:type IV pilus assembly protein PilY1